MKFIFYYSKVNVSPFMDDPLILAQAGYFQYIYWKKQVINPSNAWQLLYDSII